MKIKTEIKKKAVVNECKQIKRSNKILEKWRKNDYKMKIILKTNKIYNKLLWLNILMLLGIW